MIEKVSFPKLNRSSKLEESRTTPQLIKEAVQQFLLQKQYRKAESALEIAQALDPYDPEISYLLGITSLALNKPHRSILHLKRVINSDLSFVFRSHARLLLAYANINLERYEEAIKTLEDYIKENGEDYFSLEMLGYAHSESGNRDEAIKIYEKLVEKYPDKYVPMNNLAYALIETEEDQESLKKAEILATRAYGMNSDDPYIVDTYGWMLHKLGEYKRAHNILNIALEIATRNNYPEKLKKIIREHIKSNDEERRI